MKAVSFALPNGLELGGVTVWSVNLARSLSEIGFTTRILEHNADAATHGPADAADIPRLQLPGPTFALSGAEMRHLAETYARTLPGVIVPNYSTGTYATCALLSRSRSDAMRVIGFAHTDEEEYYAHLSYYEPIIHRFVAVSDEIRDRLAERIPGRSGDIVVKPYGIHIPASFSHSYSKPEAPIRLVFAGRLVETQKRVSDLVHLVGALHERGVDFTLSVAGEGEGAQTLIERLRTHPEVVHGRVSLLGRLPHAEMEQLWRTSDVCILTSAYEGCSIAMLEAMANGCVPVVTAVSGTRAFIEQGRSGFTVPVGDVAAFVEAIVLLARERERLPEMGRAAYEAVAAACEYTEYVDWFAQLAHASWQEEARVWPRFRPYFRPTLHEVLMRSSRFIQRRAPRLFGIYEQVNYHVHRVLGRLPE